jgi:hypothetical protein
MGDLWYIFDVATCVMVTDNGLVCVLSCFNIVVELSC